MASKDSKWKPIEADLTEADRLLPSANVIRIMRHSLPSGCKVSSEAKEVVLEATTELIGFITNHSIEEHMLKAKRKTLLHDDIIQSLNDLDLNIYSPPLNAYLLQRNNRKRPLKKSSATKPNEQGVSNNNANNDTNQDFVQSEIFDV
eukprot:677274_1